MGEIEKVTMTTLLEICFLLISQGSKNSWVGDIKKGVHGCKNKLIAESTTFEDTEDVPIGKWVVLTPVVIWVSLVQGHSVGVEWG